jgi:hypothetical protein
MTEDFFDGEILDAGEEAAHQIVFGKVPVLLAVGAILLPGFVVFVHKLFGLHG